MLSSPEGRCLLHLLKNNNFSADNFKNIDQKKFLELLKQHRLSIWFFENFIKNSPTNFAHDDFIRQALEEIFKQNTLRSLFKSAELIQIYTHFTQHNIPLLFLKGELLSLQIYQALNARISGDIDILINFTDLILADKILKNLGYQRAGTPNTLLKNFKSFLHWLQKDMIYTHPQKKIMVEVHWRFVEDPRFMNIPFEKLWERKTLVTLNNNNLPTLGAEDNLLYLCLHGAKHGYLRLQWLIDIQNYFEYFKRLKSSQNLNSQDSSRYLFNQAANYQIQPHYALTEYLIGKYLSSTEENKNKNKNKNKKIEKIDSNFERLFITTEKLWHMPESKKRRLYLAFIFKPLLYKNIFYFLPALLRIFTEKIFGILKSLFTFI